VHPHADSLRSLLTRADDPAGPSWRHRKRARLADDEPDALQRFQNDCFLEMNDDAGPVRYWLRAAAGRMSFGPALATMGVEMSSIPAVCTKAVRHFDGYVNYSYSGPILAAR